MGKATIIAAAIIAFGIAFGPLTKVVHVAHCMDVIRDGYEARCYDLIYGGRE